MSLPKDILQYIAENKPVSVRTLYKAFPHSQSVVRMVVSNLHTKDHKIYIAKWRREVEGMKPRMMPLFAPGMKPDAPRPPKPKRYAKVSENKKVKFEKAFKAPVQVPASKLLPVRSVFDLGAFLNAGQQLPTRT